MQNQSIIRFKFFAFLLLVVCLVSLPPAIRAAITLKTDDASGTTSITGNTNWSDSLAPSGTKDYSTGAHALRTPAGSSPIFLGNSLSIESGGTLLGKAATANRSLTVTNLNLNGGVLEQAGTSDSIALTVAGGISVNADSKLGALAKSTANVEQLILTAPISGSAALQIPDQTTNGGTVVLSAANPYSGTLTVNNANGWVGSAVNRLLQLNNQNALSNATLNLTFAPANPVSFASAANTAPFNLGALTGSSTQALTDTASAAVTLSVGGYNGSGTFAGVLTGGGALTKVGAGTLTLSQAQTYTGNTTVSNGVLNVTGSLVSGSAVTVDGAAGGTLAGSGIINGTVTLQNGGIIEPSISGSANTLTFANSAAPTYSSSGSTLKLRVSGTSVDQVNFSAAASHSLANLDLVLDLAGAGGAVSGATIYSVASGDMSTAAFKSVTLINNSGSFTATVHYNTTTITVDLAVPVGPVNAAHSTISPATASKFADGVSTQTITVQARDASNLNRTTGGDTVVFSATAGTLSPTTDNHDGTYTATWTAPAAIGTGSATVTATLVGTAVGTAVGATNSVITLNTVTLTWAVGNGDWDINTTANWAEGGVTGFKYKDAENVILDDTASGSSPIAVNVAQTVTPGSVTANLTNTSYTLSGNAIAGGGSLTKNGTNILTLVNSNSYSGGTILVGGILNITNDSALGATSGGITFSGSSTLQAGANVALSATRNVTLNTGVTGTLDPQANQLTVNGNISGAGTLSKPTGAGTLVLAGNNSGWTGSISLPSAVNGTNGWLQLASSTALGTGKTIDLSTKNQAAATGGVQLSGGVTITNSTILLGGRTTTDATDLSFLQNVSGTNVWAGTIQLKNTGGSYYINSLAGRLELSGLITNAINNASARQIHFLGAGEVLVSGAIENTPVANNVLNVQADGPGVLTLTGTNTYTGTTVANGGTLVIGTSGVVPTNTVTVATNANLGGNGLILGVVVVADGGTLTSGTTAVLGTLTISNTLTLAANSTNIFRLDATGTGTNDSIAGLTGVTYGGSLIVNNVNGTPALGQVYHLFNSAAYSGTFASTNLPILPPTLAWSNNLAGDGTIQVVSAGSASSTNALLTSLTITPAGNFTPGFASGVFAYTTTNSYGSTPTVTVTNADLTATNVLIYNGTTNLLASGVASSALTLSANPGVTNVIKVQVTAQDGVTVNTYTVNVQQLPSVSSRPVLTNSIGVNNLTLNWPLANLGYRLQIQTNSLSTGLSGNWVDWPNSTQTNNAVIPVSPGNPSVFLRLVYP